MLEMLDIAIGFATVMLAVSLIIMSLTQAVAGLLNLRGAKLHRGLEELIKQTLPTVVTELAKNRITPKDLSEKILRHPLVCDSATAPTGRWGLATAIKVQELLPVLDDVLHDLKVKPVVDEERKRLAAWFDSFMARVSQWFVMNTRWITVGLAVPIAFAMHLDSVDVLKQLKADSETRAKLSAMSASLLDQTPEAINQTESAYRTTLDDLAKANAGQFVAAPDAATREAVASKPEALAWIRDNAKDASEVQDLTKKFNAALEDKLADGINRSIDRAKTLQSELASAGISIYPGGDHTWRHWVNPISAHFWGIVASVLFLSLGAPFWFNMLKNMTSLKSVVARQEEQEARPLARIAATADALAAQAPPALPAKAKELAKLPQENQRPPQT